MKLSIGENIKHFRKSRDITQERLAEMLGVSCQSVSRWESGICYPDVELLPVIAGIFEVTVDKLLGVDEIAERKKVDEYLHRFQEAISKGEIDACISIAREGVAEYPNNYALLNKLMYALFVSGDDTGNIAGWEENKKKYDAEITALGERIMQYCPDQDIRLDAISRLAFHHCEEGRKKQGRAIYETLPPMEACRETNMWWCLEENEKLPYLKDWIQKSYDLLESGIWLLATCGLLPDTDSLSVMAKLVQLQDLICDGNQSRIDTWGNARIHYDMAKMYARLGAQSEALEQLCLTAKKAVDFDNRPEAQSFSSLLLGTVTEKKQDFETADTRPLCEIMRDSWLQNPDFDGIRHTPEFQKVFAMLEDC